MNLSQILVVGARSVGLTLTCELARHGVHPNGYLAWRGNSRRDIDLMQVLDCALLQTSVI